MKKYMINWKTTSAGILAIAGAITRIVFALQDKAITEEAVLSALTGFLTGLGLLFARDFDKSSEQSGVNSQPPPTQNP